MPRRKASKKAKGKMAEKTRMVPVNPFALSAMFLNYCIENGWLVREQRGNAVAYFLTDKGRRELPKLGIDISQI